MSNQDDAQSVVDQLQALHDGLIQVWLKASNAGQYDLARTLNDEADRAGDQLIDAQQSLLAAIDSGEDITNLLAKMAGLSARIEVVRQQVAAGTAAASEISNVLDTVGQVVTLARTAAAA